MNYYVLPATPEEIAEYERQEAERQKEFDEKLKKITEEWIKGEFERVGLTKEKLQREFSKQSAETSSDCKAQVKEDLKSVLLKHKLHVGSSEAASILRELADEWDD